jgi:hypothetical protein
MSPTMRIQCELASQLVGQSTSQPQHGHKAAAALDRSARLGATALPVGAEGFLLDAAQGRLDMHATASPGRLSAGTALYLSAHRMDRERLFRTNEAVQGGTTSGGRAAFIVRTAVSKVVDLRPVEQDWRTLIYSSTPVHLPAAFNLSTTTTKKAIRRISVGATESRKLKLAPAIYR